MSTSPFINKLDQMTGQLPGAVTPRSGCRATGCGDPRGLAHIRGGHGYSHPATMQAAKKRIGGEFKDVLSR